MFSHQKKRFRVVILIFTAAWKHLTFGYGGMRFADLRVPRAMAHYVRLHDKKPVEGSNDLCYIPAKQARISTKYKIQTVCRSLSHSQLLAWILLNTN
jgi:hypothetical protein